MEIQVALSLLTLISQEARLIDELNKCCNFDHNIFLADSSVDIAYLVGHGTQPRSLFIYGNANGSIKHLERLAIVESKNPFMIVVPVSSSLRENLELLTKIKKVQRRTTNMKIGIFFPTNTTMNNIRDHFLWLREQSVVNGFAATYMETKRSLNIFTYHSFGTFQVINVTAKRTCEGIFPSLDSNYHLHKFRMTKFVTDVDKKFWLAMFQAMNATFTVIKTIDYNSFETMPEYFQNGIDVFSTFGSINRNITPLPMYPIVYNIEKIVVPEAESYSSFYAYLQMFASNELFAYLAGALSAIVVTLSVCRFIENRKLLFIQSSVDTVNLLINDNSNIKYQRLSRAEAFLIGSLTFVGFIVVNGYLSDFQSYMTKPVLKPQIKTVADIYNSPLVIVTPVQMLRKLLDTINHRSTEEVWDEKIFIMEPASYRKQFYNFNHSQSYVINDRYFDMMLRIQRRLNVRGYYDTGTVVATSFSMFPISETVLFPDKRNEVILWLHSSGLFHRWMVQFFATTEKRIIAAHRKKIKNQQATSDVLEFPIFIAFGWIVGVIILFIEILWARARQWFRLQCGLSAI